MHTVALTCGEPAGIGPDLVSMLARHDRNIAWVAIGDKQVLQERAALRQIPLSVNDWQPGQPVENAAGQLSVLHCATAASVQAGTLDTRNAAHVLKTLDVAIDGCIDGTFSAMVTAPLHKGVINDAGVPFTGHTEYLAKKTNADPVMMLAVDSFRVALATTHIPLSAVATAISDTVLNKVLTTLHHELETRFGIARPHILVCGLNPHAGEGGHLGREEIDIIEPALHALRKKGLWLTGPLPADTLFTPQHLDDADAVLAMYHDQGLPVLKFAGFGNAVNVTLGLPIIRTSVDHGTALDKAGSDGIHTGSLLAALDMAVEMCRSRQ